MCGSYESEVLTPAFLQTGETCNFQQIVICKKCGLVYKNPVIPEVNKLVYRQEDWGSGENFKKRAKDLTDYLGNFLGDIKPKTVIEVGPGPGWLALALKKILPDCKYIMFEASENVAKLAKSNVPDAVVIPSSIGDMHFSQGFASLVISCGVDYLFTDFRRNINNIYRSLTDEGYLYIERNVFVESEAYNRFKIETYRDLFGQNELMTTWFAVDQYREFLKLRFEVVSENSFLLDKIDDNSSVIYGFLCKKKRISKEFYDGSATWYDQNLVSLRRLDSFAPNEDVKGSKGLDMRGMPSLLNLIKAKVRSVIRPQ